MHALDHVGAVEHERLVAAARGGGNPPRGSARTSRASLPSRRRRRGRARGWQPGIPASHGSVATLTQLCKGWALDSVREIGGRARRVPYGSWPTPITSAVVVAEAVGLSEVRVDGDGPIWTEGRPAEGGRTRTGAQVRPTASLDRSAGEPSTTPAPPCTSTAVAPGGSATASSGSPTGRTSVSTCSRPGGRDAPAPLTPEPASSAAIATPTAS